MVENCIVDTLEPITLIGGGAGTIADVQDAQAVAPICVAADGGAVLAARAGAKLVAIIGDFDSVPLDVLAQIPANRQHHIAEQMSTDFDKALRHIHAPVVVAVGFSGARVDHQLGCFHTLTYHPHKPCVILAESEVIFLCPKKMTLPTVAGDIVSLFPMAAVTGRSVGLKWPIDGLAFDPLTRVGTSNQAMGPVTLELDGPQMLCIAPRRIMPQVVQLLSTLPAPARWPVRER
ncbi:MAG: thiamine diphosphokinase [Sulfitobacter sp.]